MEAGTWKGKKVLSSKQKWRRKSVLVKIKSRWQSWLQRLKRFPVLYAIRLACVSSGDALLFSPMKAHLQLIIEIKPQTVFCSAVVKTTNILSLFFFFKYWLGMPSLCLILEFYSNAGSWFSIPIEMNKNVSKWAQYLYSSISFSLNTLNANTWFK